MTNAAVFSVRDVKIRISFGFFAVWSVLIMQSASSGIGIYALISCILHETGHITAMGINKIKPSRLTLYSGGISMKSTTPVNLACEIFILSAGCLVNLLLCCAFWRVNRIFSMVNLSLLLFNLLPLPTLDGGRIISALCERYLNIDISKTQKIFGVAAGIVLAVFMFIKGNINFTLPLTLGLIILESIIDEY